MSRPTPCRRICTEPDCLGFTPRSARSAGEIVMTVDEYEVIRLVDYEKRTHGQCAAQMGVSRTTVTEIYENARFKLSDGLVNGKALVMDGGHDRVCQGNRERGLGRNCQWTVQAKKGEATMRIAVPCENGQVFQHFGHTRQMKICDAESGNIMKEQIADTTGSGHGALAGFLAGLNVDVLICGSIIAMVKNAVAPVMRCGQKTTELVPGITEAAACFALCEGDGAEAVYACRNLHSLWIA